MEKICFKCGISKELTEFYKHPGMADGRLNKCKDCTKKEVRANRRDKIDYYIEYERSRVSSEKRIRSKKKYSSTAKGKMAREKSRKNWLRANVVKRAATILVGNYVRDGKLIKSNRCSECGKGETRIHGHHDDYALPLQVRWLCRKCHNDWHKEHGPGING